VALLGRAIRSRGITRGPDERVATLAAPAAAVNVADLLP